MEHSICLIGGTGRSGTSVLRRIFSSHPDISDVPEWRFLVDPDGIVDFYTTCQVWSPYHYDLKVKRLERLLRKVGKRHPLKKLYTLLPHIGILPKTSWNLRSGYVTQCATDTCPDFLHFVDDLIKQLTTFRYSGYWIGMDVFGKGEIIYGSIPEKAKISQVLRNFLWQVIQSVLNDQQVTHYLEKNTWNLLWFDKILELLPEARFVHIYRDPRDVIASYMQQVWMPSDAIQCAHIYQDIIERWWNIREQIPENSFMEVSLESLVANPETILRKICTFWNIPWHACLLKINLSKSHTGRWKQDFNSNEQREIQSLLQAQLEMMKYE